MPAGGSKPLRIDVVGQQYIWSSSYPDGAYSYGEMVAPVGVTVELHIISRDVAHSWWIPKLGGKFDAIPGYVNHTWFRLQRPGVYRGQCAELCGRNHADMLAPGPRRLPGPVRRVGDEAEAVDPGCWRGDPHTADPRRGWLEPRCPPSSRQRVLARRRPTRRSSPTASMRGPRGGCDWVRTTDHKRIGILYLVTAFAFMMLGGVEALLMRTSARRAGQHPADARRSTTRC